MNKFLLAIKGETTRRFTQKGEAIPVTKLDCEDCHLLGFRTQEKDGYNSAILGVHANKNTPKSVSGLSKKFKLETSLSSHGEFRIDETVSSLKFGETEISLGEKLTPEIVFVVGEKIKITGVSKGKGFAGVVKRHKFAGGPRTHGQTDRERAPGSIGQTTTPGRVYKGKRMAGRMGTETVTIRGVEVIEVTPNAIYVKGMIPGHVGTIIRLSGQDKKN